LVYGYACGAESAQEQVLDVIFQYVTSAEIQLIGIVVAN